MTKLLASLHSRIDLRLTLKSKRRRAQPGFSTGSKTLFKNCKKRRPVVSLANNGKVPNSEQSKVSRV